MTGFSSGDRTPDFLVRKSGVRSDDTLVKWEAQELLDQEVQGSTPGAKTVQNTESPSDLGVRMREVSIPQ